MTKKQINKALKRIDQGFSVCLAILHAYSENHSLSRGGVMKYSSMIVDIITYVSCLLACLYFVGEVRERNILIKNLQEQIINEKLILLDNKAFRCNQVLSDVGAKPRGKK